MSLSRLTDLRPWDNVNEEDLYRVDGLYLSIRGNVRSPVGVWATTSRDNAARWIAEPDTDPSLDDFVYDAAAAKVTGSLPVAKVEKALDKLLDQFEGKPCEGVEFPIWLNPE